MSAQTDITLTVRHLGLQDYVSVWHEMQAFTQKRDELTSDEIWFVEHPPVYTLGLNGKNSHILDPGSIPIVNVDRGGQVTYHGPGQLVAYTLVNLKRHHMGIREFVRHLEQTIIDLLASMAISAYGRENAPGVYVEEAKIAALGLRVKKHCTYHGLSLNVDMNLEPFQRINPCGYEGMAVTQLRDLGAEQSLAEIQKNLLRHFCRNMGYNIVQESLETDPIHESSR